MTVKELIELLEKYPGELRLVVATEDEDWDIVSDYEQDGILVLDILPS